MNAILGDQLQAAHQEFVEEIWSVSDEFNAKNAMRSSAMEHVLLRAAKDSIRKRADLVESAWRRVLNAFGETGFLSPDVLGLHAEEVLRSSATQVEEMLRTATPWRTGAPLDVIDQLSRSVNALKSSLAVTLLMNSQAMLTSIPSAKELEGFLGAFHRDHPDPNRCGFLMMPFGDTPAHQRIDRCVREVCSALGLEALRADDRRYSDDLLPNIRTYMHGCGFGIAVFERLANEHFNPNVSLEVGYMFALGKPVCLLKDGTLSALQSDLVGRLYENFDVQNVEDTLLQVLRKWLAEKRLTK